MGRVSPFLACTLGDTIEGIVVVPIMVRVVVLMSCIFRDSASALTRGVIARPSAGEAAGTGRTVAGALLLGGVAEVACFSDGRGADECGLLLLVLLLVLLVLVWIVVLMLLVLLVLLVQRRGRDVVRLRSPHMRMGPLQLEVGRVVLLMVVHRYLQPRQI
jgi:hypothetical protein